MDESPDRLTLSTGHEVALPLEMTATVGALAVTADIGGARDLLPAGLAPVRVTPRRTVVVFASVDYSRVGDGAIDPYEELGVFLPATTATGRLPTLRALGGHFGGYTVALPVTTEPARALGVEGWGYPKTVADIAVTREADGRRTTVADDDGHVVTLTIPHETRLPQSRPAGSFTDADGLCRQPIRLDGRAGVRALAGEYSLGDHPLADRVRSLDPGRVLAALSFEGSLVLEANERLEAGG